MKLVFTVMITRMIFRVFDKSKKREVNINKVTIAAKDPAAFNLR